MARCVGEHGTSSAMLSDTNSNANVNVALDHLFAFLLLGGENECKSDGFSLGEWEFGKYSLGCVAIAKSKSIAKMTINKAGAEVSK